MSRVAVTGGSGFIGSYLVGELVGEGHDVLNLDLRRPQAHAEVWREVDITEAAAVTPELERFRPEAVVHLAARTDTLSDDVEDYAGNWVGTEVTCRAAVRVGATRYLSTSTQYVHATDTAPDDDQDFSPFTAYGESKVRSEQVTRKVLDGSGTDYVIVRPTNIWGPRHPRYPSEFWRVLGRGLYVHPAVTPPVVRAYGYVGTVTWQLRALLSIADLPSHEVLYVGDRLLLLDDWVDAFSVALRGRRARRVSPRVLTTLGRVGDLMGRAGVRAPLTSSRVGNMIGPSDAPMDRTFELLGESPWTLDAGVAETVRWLRESSEGGP
ncbi:MAG TPA: NAD(P)-dependent oxidoreductase [Nocardioides sp.]|uniref:NAD-dependent epimerase/dehydratase family protein n=1 Tax=Nocardioides sp. TaxID=35761 RepID=UPI002E374560|nr:NAD(P)-dependent oxidoreductase [Nocardioides sp.]HEX3932294.1 NAD(P)-dependent oxidoreductase [Nocardioides sp.]